MFRPKYTITNEILKNIGLVEASKEVIDNAPLVPAWEKRFREEALIRTVHYGTHLEGNKLSFSEAKDVLEGEKVLARDRDIQEVINYRSVLKYIDEKAKTEKYTLEQLKRIHFLTVQKLIDKDLAGEFRHSQVVLRSSRDGSVSFRPPSYIEVPHLVNEFLEWLNSEEAQKTHPVILASITHYVIAAIHPFVEGNGRTARALATLVLFAEGYDIKRFFSLEESFDKDALAYFNALMKVSDQSEYLDKRDLTTWIEYFSRILSEELGRIKEKIRKLSLDIKIKGRLGQQIALSERQMKLVEYLEEFKEITVPQGRQVLPMVSDDTLLRDLKDLVSKKIIIKKGKTKAAKYVLK